MPIVPPGATMEALAGSNASSSTSKSGEREMIVMAGKGNGARVDRVDKFKVPGAARDEFLASVDRVHEILRQQPGLVDEVVLEQTGGPGSYNIVTIAVWESAEAIGAARKAVAQRYAEIGFKPAAPMARPGIDAGIADYAPVSS
jgi:hypothetical protein